MKKSNLRIYGATLALVVALLASSRGFKLNGNLPANYNIDNIPNSEEETIIEERESKPINEELAEIYANRIKEFSNLTIEDIISMQDLTCPIEYLDNDQNQYRWLVGYHPYIIDKSFDAPGMTEAGQIIDGYIVVGAGWVSNIDGSNRRPCTFNGAISVKYEYVTVLHYLNSLRTSIKERTSDATIELEKTDKENTYFLPVGYELYCLDENSDSSLSFITTENGIIIEIDKENAANYVGVKKDVKDFLDKASILEVIVERAYYDQYTPKNTRA